MSKSRGPCPLEREELATNCPDQARQRSASTPSILKKSRHIKRQFRFCVIIVAMTETLSEAPALDEANGMAYILHTIIYILVSVHYGEARFIYTMV